MSLHVTLLVTKPTAVYSDNITHNLAQMAVASGIYMYLWRPDELGITEASELIKPLREGLAKLKTYRTKFEKHNPENGWGDYNGLVKFVTNYLEACEAEPSAAVSVCR